MTSHLQNINYDDNDWIIMIYDDEFTLWRLDRVTTWPRILTVVWIVFAVIFAQCHAETESLLWWCFWVSITFYIIFYCHPSPKTSRQISLIFYQISWRVIVKKMCKISANWFVGSYLNLQLKIASKISQPKNRQNLKFCNFQVKFSISSWGTQILHAHWIFGPYP